jgi:hypothetical protein
MASAWQKDRTNARGLPDLDQLEDLLAVVATQMPYWCPMIKLVSETGLRWGEAAGLPVGNLDRGRVRVDRAEPELDGRGNWTIGLPKGGRTHA